MKKLQLNSRLSGVLGPMACSIFFIILVGVFIAHLNNSSSHDPRTKVLMIFSMCLVILAHVCIIFTWLRKGRRKIEFHLSEVGKIESYTETSISLFGRTTMTFGAVRQITSVTIEESFFFRKLRKGNVTIELTLCSSSGKAKKETLIAYGVNSPGTTVEEIRQHLPTPL